MNNNYKIDRMVGTEVTEEEAAKFLGFSDVFEFRRWKTEEGHKTDDANNRAMAAEREVEDLVSTIYKQDELLREVYNLLCLLWNAGQSSCGVDEFGFWATIKKLQTRLRH